VTSKWAKGSGGPAGNECQNLVAAPFVKAKRARSADDDETWQADRPAPTLSVFDSGDTRATVAIVTPAPEPIAFHPTQDPISSVGVTHTIGTGTTGGAATIAVAQAYAVRRLTPTECERLQGFPDDWTDVSHRGKSAADGPRYKAVGNSMAVPVMRWIGERIDAVDKATKAAAVKHWLTTEPSGKTGQLVTECNQLLTAHTRA
jgi:DNA (cytosine-5)-methyltransferase 1